MYRAPAKPSSPGWNMKITVPGSSACRALSSFAAPASMAVCRSWPQACIVPGMADAYGSPVSSVTGSASMSPRSSTTGPGRAAAQHRGHRAERRPRADLERQPGQGVEHLALRLRQVQADLGLAVDRMPQLGDLARQLRRLVAYQHELPPQLGAPAHPIARQPDLPGLPPADQWVRGP